VLSPYGLFAVSPTETLTLPRPAVVLFYYFFVTMSKLISNPSTLSAPHSATYFIQIPVPHPISNTFLPLACFVRYPSAAGNEKKLLLLVVL